MLCVFVFFWRENMQCGVIVVWLRRSICWNVGGTERRRSAYSTQHMYQNHLSHSEYCSIQPFHRTGNTMHDISFMSVGVSCFVLLIALDIFDELPQILLKGRMFKKKRKADRKHSCNNMACTMEVKLRCMHYGAHYKERRRQDMFEHICHESRESLLGKVKCLFLSVRAFCWGGAIVHQGNLYTTRVIPGGVCDLSRREKSISFLFPSCSWEDRG